MRQNSQQDSHSRRLRIYSLFSHFFFCFRNYLFTFIAFARELSTSTMNCHAIYVAINEFLRNVDRLEEWNSLFETKFEEDEKIMLRACLEKNFDWVLFYQRKFIWELMWAWHIFLFLTFDLHVHICSLNQIFTFLLLLLLVKHVFWQLLQSQRLCLLLNSSRRFSILNLQFVFNSTSNTSTILSLTNWSSRINVSHVINQIIFEESVSMSTNIKSVIDTSCK